MSERTIESGLKAGDELQIFIPGKPKGKQRPRVVRGHAFTPQQTKDYELMIANLYRALHGKMIDGYVSVEIYVLYLVPKSYTKKKQEQIRRRELLPAVKPDIDNIIKIVLDGLNGVAYKDDAQVIEVTAKKVYTFIEQEEGVIVSVEEYRPLTRSDEEWNLPMSR